VSDTSAIHGRCHCGDIEFRLAGAPKFPFLCHCDNCRKLNGGSRLAAVTFDRAALEVVSGTPASYRYPGGKDRIESYFCPRCATPLFAFPAAHAEIVVVRVNALDEPNAFGPKKAFFEEQACAWDRR
jgi:hypothetical protein